MVPPLPPALFGGPAKGNEVEPPPVQADTQKPSTATTVVRATSLRMR
jgi:hypothetical protein